MPDVFLDEIKEVLSLQHEGDEKQLEVIFSDSSRLIVEAPAGYGKTTTMISRIAFLFASGRVPNPKRILGLTFSVNAALKIKRDVAEKLPSLLSTQNNPISLSDKVTITNYHGFCKGVLKKYGYLLSDSLRKDTNLFRAIDEGGVGENPDLKLLVTTPELDLLKRVDVLVKATTVPDRKMREKYLSIISRLLLPLNFITHNAVLLLTVDLFEKYPEIRKFYQNYYPLIVVDEFQDTNGIAWQLLKQIISENTQLVFLGDPLQRIYGFIGALPDIMTLASDEYNMEKVVLSKNYRFRNNPEMLKLDKNIRANAACGFDPHIDPADVSQLPLLWGITQQNEAQQIAAKAQSLLNDDGDRIAILFKGRGVNAEIVEAELTANGIQYFYGMFTDEDPDYTRFHAKCQELFIEKFGGSRVINKRAMQTFSRSVKNAYSEENGRTVDSLLKLLDALIEKVSVDYADLLPEDKYNLLLDVFDNRQLKQAMEYVESRVILSTIHGAKGLEWEYVIISDVEQWVLSFNCRDCTSPDKNNPQTNCCRLPQNISGDFKSALLDDLCVFYVGLTRARKQAFVSASSERFNANGRRFVNGKICCLALVTGVELAREEL